MKIQVERSDETIDKARNRLVIFSVETTLVVTEDPLETYLIDSDGTTHIAYKYLGIRPKSKFPDQMSSFLKDVECGEGMAYLWAQKGHKTIVYNPK